MSYHWFLIKKMRVISYEILSLTQQIYREDEKTIQEKQFSNFLE